MTTTDQRFEAAALDQYARQVTMGVALLGGVLLLPVLFLYLSGLLLRGVGTTGALLAAGIALALLLWLLLSYAAAAQRYTIGADTLVIKRRWLRAIRVPLASVVAVMPTTQLAGDNVRALGVRRVLNFGVFGYAGRITLEPYGGAYFCATNRGRLVVVARVQQQALLLSPERPQMFVEALRAALMQRGAQERDSRA